MPRRRLPTDNVPELESLAASARAYQSDQRARRKSWTRELPSVARRYGAVPLTVGGAIGLFAALMRLWAFSGEVEEQTRVKVERAIATHNRSNMAHRAELGEAHEINQRTWQTVVELQVQLRELQTKVGELHAPAARRRRR